MDLEKQVSLTDSQAFFHEVIGQENSFAQNLLFSDDAISTGFKEWSSYDGSFCMNDRFAAGGFKNIAEGRSNSFILVICCNKQMIQQILLFIQISESDNLMALPGNNGLMLQKRLIPFPGIRIADPGFPLLWTVISGIDGSHRILEQLNELWTVLGLVGSEHQILILIHETASLLCSDD